MLLSLGLPDTSFNAGLELTAAPSNFCPPMSQCAPSMSSTTTPPTVRLTRHGEFWLYDGSIVLAVENTLFRVHQTILANHSEVFADLFTIPQPEGEDMIDGCPVVHLYDDREQDFADLLRAMYHPEYVPSPRLLCDKY